MSKKDETPPKLGTQTGCEFELMLCLKNPDAKMRIKCSCEIGELGKALGEGLANLMAQLDAVL